MTPVEQYRLSAEMCRSLGHLRANEVQTAQPWYALHWINKNSAYALERRGLVTINYYQQMISLTEAGRKVVQP